MKMVENWHLGMHCDCAVFLRSLSPISATLRSQLVRESFELKNPSSHATAKGHSLGWRPGAGCTAS